MAQTQTPTPILFHPWPPIFTHTHALNPFTHGSTLRHPSPHPLHPWPRHRHPSLGSFHPLPTILIHTHALNPFTHGPKHCQTPIPDPLHPWPIHRHPSLSPFTHGPQYLYTPTPKPFHPWPLTLVDTHPSTLSPMALILTDTHPLNPFNPGPKHSQTWNPQLCAGALGRSRGKGGIRDGVVARG